MSRVDVPVTVEFEDVDAYRIAHHTRLIAYLERARMRLLFGDGDLGTADAVVPVMYGLELRFHKPAHMLDELIVSAELVEATDVTLSLRYQIRRPKTDDLLLRARSIVAFADATRGAPRPVPPALRERLARTRAAS